MHLIAKDGKVCVRDGALVTSANGAPCVCEGGDCLDQLPRRVRIQFGGSFHIRVVRTSTTVVGGDLTTSDTMVSNVRVTMPTVDLVTEGARGIYFLPESCGPYPAYVTYTQTITRFDVGFGTGVTQRQGSFNSVRFALFNLRRQFESPGVEFGCIFEGFQVPVSWLGRERGKTANDTEFGPWFPTFNGLDESLSMEYQSRLRPPLDDHSTGGWRDALYIEDFDGSGTRGSFGGGLIWRQPGVFTDVDTSGNGAVVTTTTETSSGSYPTISIEDATGQEVDCPGLGTVVEAYPCGDPGGARITVDLADALEGVVSTPQYNGTLYVPTADRSTQEPDTRVWVEDFCTGEEEWPVYVNCDTNFPNDKILVDESERPANARSVVIGERVYVPTGEVQAGAPLRGLDWSELGCPGNNPILAKCGDATATIVAEDVTREPGQDWAYYNSELYRVTQGVSEGPPVIVQWTTDECEQDDRVWRMCPDSPLDGTVFEPTFELVRIPSAPDAEHIRVRGQLLVTGGGGALATLYYRREGNDSSRPEIRMDIQSVISQTQCSRGFLQPRPVDDDPTRPDDFALSSDDETGIGNLLADAIKLISAGTVEPCSSCEKRRRLLNRYGNKVGRALIRRLRL